MSYSAGSAQTGRTARLSVPHIIIRYAEQRVRASIIMVAAPTGTFVQQTTEASMDYTNALPAADTSEPVHKVPSLRTTRWLAWFCWGISTAQAAFGLVLARLNRLTLERFFAEYVVSQTGATLAFATIGLLIAPRRPKHPIGWLF